MLTIIFHSQPAVFGKYNAGGWDCPDLELFEGDGEFPDDFSDFYVMLTKVESIGINPSTILRRLSTPSYVDATPGTPLNFYTQWVWYRQERDGPYTPFYPGALQYTLEEKYLSGQDKYYFEFEQLRLMVDMVSLEQTNLDTKRSSKLIRRPIFVPSDKSKIPEMYPMLLHDLPEHLLTVPDHWSAVDHFQDFELVELSKTSAEYIAVQQQFLSTMDERKHQTVHIFRVQNPGLWDKYCSARRAMAARDQKSEHVAERPLFHGTPTLEAAMGICANSFDFRRSGEHVGTTLGKGAYFSTTAKYSHSYTRVHTPVTGDPLRFMFLGRILVGQYTLGDPSYTKPPVRDRRRLYDSCVNDVSKPSIFVIFDLAQSYPEYLIQYTDASDRRRHPQVRRAISVQSLVVTTSPVDTTPGRMSRAKSVEILSLTFNVSSSSSSYDARSHKKSTFKRKIKKMCVIS
ncbi:hypothetical protein C0Q70_02490 [Pomacea canaliculata]|uniref:Poly [ADP-ribose] polymerase n=1 Tax=Pomacea canaliculata TaxID=400727 RepID=A0A2T7PQ73_POMCA|nr:hypothetical protein C0Q70_02490 [Pomacea canaliculata]